MEGASGGCAVRVLSRRMVRPLTTPPPTANGKGDHHRLKGEEIIEVIHLTPWDLRLISIDYIQKGILLPKPPAGGDVLVTALATSFARALGRFYSFAGRLAADEREDGTVTLSLLCTGEGAEFVHATAPDVTVDDIVASLYIPPVVWAFYPLQEVLGADATFKHLPLVAVQVTELADGVFIGISMNHSAGDGTAFWHFFNTWSEIHRRGYTVHDLSAPAPVLRRWLVETSPVPIPMPFKKLQDIVRRFERTTVQECFFTFSTASAKKLKAPVGVRSLGSILAISHRTPAPKRSGDGENPQVKKKKLKARANDEMAGNVQFLLDSGASMHVVGYARLLRRLRPLPQNAGRSATLPDGSRLRIIGIGDIQMNGFSIPDVYLVEGLTVNLVSVGRLTTNHGICCFFYGNRCCLTTLADGSMVGEALLNGNGVYGLRFLRVPDAPAE